MKYSDVIKGIKSVSEVTSSEYTPVNNTDLVNKKYVDDTVSAASVGGEVDLTKYALKTELHSHDNKTVLDTITSDKIVEWDNKLSSNSEEIVFEGDGTDSLVLNDYYTHVSIADGMGFWVINKTIEIDSSNNPYTIEISGGQANDGIYGPDVATFNSTYNMWVYDLGNGYKFQMGNIDYDGSSALAVAWDDAGSYLNLKITKKVSLNIVDQTYVQNYVNQRISNLSILAITQGDYDALEAKDPNTLYLITTMEV